MKFTIEAWKPLQKGTLHGFADVIFDGELRVNGIAIRAGKSGLFASMPARSFETRDGKTKWEDHVAFVAKERSTAFSEALVGQLRKRGDLP